MVATHTIELGELWDGWDGQWVKIKPWKFYAARERINASALDITKAGKDDPMAVSRNVLAVTIAYVEEQVIEWNLIGYDGDPLPQGRAGVLSEAAPPDLIDYVIDEAETFYEAQRPPFAREKENSA